MLHDLLAEGLAELGHTVYYLLEDGQSKSPPIGVFPVSDEVPEVDICHNIESPKSPWVTTQHGFYGDAEPYPNQHTIFVSHALARAYGLDRMVWNGINPEHYVYTSEKSDYFLFLAAMQGPSDKKKYHHKGLNVALGLCKKTGIRLIVAGTAIESAVVDQIDRMCIEAGAEYVGDVRGHEKAELLAGAQGLLFPTQILEGFGLVMAEALVSGTPVICSNRGACPELIPWDAGFVCDKEADYIHALQHIDTISPRRCREIAIERYHYRQMCAGYVREYEREIELHNSTNHG
ncbi:MAG TPA: glycosyltransferase [Blastocatellia bacterium]|nr:glycosyltransferase [Blastocatellia bacterium]